MSIMKAIIKFIAGGLVGLLIWAFGFGCLQACNSYQRVASDGVMYFLLVICILVCGGGYAAEDISVAKSAIDSANARRKAMEEAREAERLRRDREEADRREKERVRMLTKQTEEKILENQGYELDILPFLDYLVESSQTDLGFENTVRLTRERSVRLKRLAQELNQVSTQYHMGVKLDIHSH